MSQDIEIDPDSRTITYYEKPTVESIKEHLDAGGLAIGAGQARALLDEIDRLRNESAKRNQAAMDISDENDRLRKENTSLNQSAKSLAHVNHQLQKELFDQNQVMNELFQKAERLEKLVPPETERGPGFVGQGSWSVFAEKVVEERDAAREGMKQLLVENSELHRVNAGLQEEVTRCSTGLDKKKEHANIHLGGKGELHGIDGYGPFNLKQVNKDRWEIWMLHEKVTLYNKKGHRVRGDHNYEGDW